MQSVIIVGGSRGIGADAARRFIAETDCRVLITYNSAKEKAQQLCNELGPERIQCAQLQLADKTILKGQLDKIMTESGPFDVVVHSAAIVQDSPLYFMTEEQWESVIWIPLNSFFYVNKACLPKMIENRNGRIISLVSVSGEAGNRGQTNYAAAKGAVIAASKSLAKEMGSRGITVNCVSPGVIETEMTANIPKERVLPMIPAERFGTVEEVSGAIVFLASDAASYVNGAVLRVNGGMYT